MKGLHHIDECADPAPLCFVSLLGVDDPWTPLEKDAWIDTWPAEEFMSPYGAAQPPTVQQYVEAEPWLLSDLTHNLARTSGGDAIEYLEVLARWRARGSEEAVLVRARVMGREELLLVTYYDDGCDFVGINTSALAIGDAGRMELQEV